MCTLAGLHPPSPHSAIYPPSSSHALPGLQPTDATARGYGELRTRPLPLHGPWLRLRVGGGGGGGDGQQVAVDVRVETVGGALLFAGVVNSSARSSAESGSEEVVVEWSTGHAAVAAVVERVRRGGSGDEDEEEGVVLVMRIHSGVTVFSFAFDHE